MTPAERIRMARRKTGMTQQQLADRLHVNRSAVGNWESQAKDSSPSLDNLRQLATVCNVMFEWLTTGRGEMYLPAHVHDTPAAHAILVEDPAEMRLVEYVRCMPAKLKVRLLELCAQYVDLYRLKKAQGQRRTRVSRSLDSLNAMNGNGPRKP